MGLSESQYRNISYRYDQIRLNNKRLLDARKQQLYEDVPEAKMVHDSIINLCLSQAKKELFNPEKAQKDRADYEQKKDALMKRKAEILEENGYDADYLSPIYTCVDCKDTGYIGSKHCHCFLQAELSLIYDYHRFAEILKEENFEHFSEDYYNDTDIDKNLSLTPRQNILLVKEAALEFIRHFDNAYENLILYGSTGVGKTFIANCIAKELLDTGHTVVYFNALQIFHLMEVQKFHRDEFSSSADEKLEFVFDCDLLIVDDLGTELTNAFIVSQLYYLVEERYSRQNSTIFTTNLSFADLRDRYSERIFSRFTGYYDFKQIIGNDIRIQKALAK